MIFFDIIWWIAWVLLALGFLSILVHVFVGISINNDEEGDGEAAVLFGPLAIVTLLLLVPAAVILLLFFIFHLAQDFTFETIADITKWIIYIAFWGQLAVSTAWGVASLSRVVVMRIRTWRKQ